MSRRVEEVERGYPLVWRIEAVPAFRASLEALPEGPAVDSVLARLALEVVACPENAQVLWGTNARVVFIERAGPLPPLRLYYSFDAMTIYLLHVEEYDDLACDD